MDAVRVYHDKEVWPDGSITELVVWRLPQPVSGSSHSYKYRLFFGAAGQRWIGYDNERGKGDHRHIGEKEEPYHFTGPQNLIGDFWQSVAEWRAARANHDDQPVERR